MGASGCTNDQIAHFRDCGFVVFRELFDGTETAALTTEVTTELTAAYGGLGTDTDPDGTGGIRGDHLPLTVNRAPLSQSLLADDPRLFATAAELLGRPVVPTAPVATCFTTNAGWHTDQGPDIGGVKFLAYLEKRTASDGALRVRRGSHRPGGDGSEVVLSTEPGDVIAFDVHLWHSSAGGDKRLAWSIQFLPWAGLDDPERVRLTRELIMDADYTDEPYDHDRWPEWRDWAVNTANPSRRLAVGRLRELGVLPGVTAAGAG